MTPKSMSPSAEWLVLGLVVLATLSIGFQVDAEPEDDLEVTQISGTVTLSTRASMNALGLDDYDRGAKATVDMEVQGIVSSECANCTGVSMQGQVNITELDGGPGGMGRVEAQLSVIHLREYASKDLISQEWLTFDWDAGSLSTQWDVMIVHDPPMWQPDDRFNAAFSEDESRTGPWVLIEALLDGSRHVQGCLPDTFTCHSGSQADIDLTSVLEPVKSATEIVHPTPWILIDNVSSTNQTPTNTEQIRELLELEGESPELHGWCVGGDQVVTSAQAWSVNSVGSTAVAPMSIYLEALALPSTSFTPVAGTWTEVDLSDRGCASLVDEAGDLRLAISISEN
ncbi:MAG: hypothetical protein VX230_03630 [Candidatus Thermoplasmatota archaeon]|nr:hypothetical protein [Candidatus Thermoplasmatota archaeon]